jgi:hypothetical protein
MLVDIILLSNWNGLTIGQTTQVTEDIATELINKAIGKKVETIKPKKEQSKPVSK